jgi:DNA mismatch repair protein MutS2
MNFEANESLEQKLDIQDFLQTFQTFFSRKHRSFFLKGDLKRHFQFIDEVSKIDFKPPPEVEIISEIILKIKKYGVLSASEIFQIVKIIRYFRYLKKQEFPIHTKTWLDKINIPDYFIELDSFFDSEGEFNDEVDERIFSIKIGIKETRNSIREQLLAIIHSQKITDYLVDTQIHLYNNSETILVRSGFQAVLNGEILGRTSSGYFYVFPNSIQKLYSKLKKYQQELEIVYFEIQDKISTRLRKFVKFITFIDKEFDRFDNYQARVFFAKTYNLEFVVPESSDKIILKNFYHPAIKKSPKPINVDFSKSVLMITGVNAGGKTMLLKSILSAVYFTKYLIPMKINSFYSKIGNFKSLEAVIEDPQNINNDISTFAGRMQIFSKLITKEKAVIGVDEIELGTDADEASALFKILIEKIIRNKTKIVITTHHKRLASLMGTNENVELLAAIYDEKKRKPTYNFLQGIVGKSYGFETAERYGIPINLVSQARKLYGEDSEKLNELIEKSTNLEKDLIKKRKILEKKLRRLEKEQKELDNFKLNLQNNFEKLENELKKQYQEVIEEAKKALKAKTVPEAHYHLTEANKKLPKKELKSEPHQQKKNYKIGDEVRYRSKIGTIIEIKSQRAKIDFNGITLNIKVSELKPSIKSLKEQQNKIQISFEQPKEQFLRLDLHGLRKEEAIEKLDYFLSNALIQGWDEVYVTHGIGQGILAKAVTDFLKKHPRVKAFMDAPPNMGGVGAKIVQL